MQTLAQALTIPGADGGTVTIQGPANFRFAANPTIANVVGTAIPFIFAFAGIALLLMLMSGGFTMLTSADNPKRIDQGKQKVTYAVVGFLVVFLAYWIVQIMGIVFGIGEYRQIFR